MAAMNFERTDYLSWYLPRMRRHDGSIALHASGMPALDPSTLAAEIGNPWDVAHRFEAAVAGWQGLDPEQVVAVPGGTGGTLLALLTLLEPGKRIWVEAPHYEPMVRQAQRLGPVSRVCRLPEQGWQVQMEVLKQQMGPDTGLVMLTEPGNPAGVFVPEQQILELADLAAANGAWLLINEVYRDFSRRPSYLGRHPAIVVVSGLSKLCGLYWARAGWLAADAGVAQRFRHALLNFGLGTQPNCAWALPVLADIDQRVAKARQAAAAGVDIVDAWVMRRPGLAWYRPEGPGFGALILPEGTNDVHLAEALHDHAGVLTVPGSLFEAPGTLRISWMGITLEQLTEGLSRMEPTLDSLAGAGAPARGA